MKTGHFAEQPASSAPQVIDNVFSNRSTTGPAFSLPPEVLIDDCDRALVEQYQWTIRTYKFGTRYATSRVNGRPVRLHRFILGVTDRWTLVDHRDGNGLNCRRDNLRTCTPAQNTWNRKRPSTNRTSGFKGVHWDKVAKQWRSQIRGGKGVRVEVGLFRSAEEAARAYDVWARRIHGEFARLNFPAPAPRSGGGL